VRSGIFRLAEWFSLSLGAWVPSAAPDHARAGGHGAADSFLVLSGGGRRGRARRVASPPAGLQQHGETIATAFTFCSVPKPVIGLRELRRVLKPDGQLIMIEHVRSAIGPLGIFMDFMTPLTSRIGPSLNRDTVGNVQKAGFRLRRVENVYLDVVKIILGRRWKSGAIYSLSLARAGVRAPRRTTSAAGRPAAIPVLAK